MGIYFIQSTVVFLYSLDSGIRFPNVQEAGEISTNQITSTAVNLSAQESHQPILWTNRAHLKKVELCQHNHHHGIVRGRG